MIIGVDLLGSETVPEEIIEGVKRALQSSLVPHNFIFYTLSPVDISSFPNRLANHIVADMITMDDNPLVAVRKKRGASMVLGIMDLKNHKIDALITTGSTGALITLAAIHLTKKTPNTRPSLIATLPTSRGNTSIVDVGGSSLINAEHLLNCAYLGVEFLQKRRSISRPKVALLNMGTESLKGTPIHQTVYQTLQNDQENFEFVGNIEGKELFSGVVDLVVTDGFTGNILLKTAEGATQFLIHELFKGLTPEERVHFSPTLERFTSDFSHRILSGAELLGVEERVIKCHGFTTADAIASAIINL